jgi:RNA polymerase sigma-70 factor (TIGR02943 family)
MTMKMANQSSSTLTDRPARPFRIAPEQEQDPAGAARRDPLCLNQAVSSAESPSIPEQWLSLHGDALFRYALLMVGDEHRAEDLVQETLLAALESLERYSAGASERTWLIAILRHKVIDDRRRNRRRDQYLGDVDPAVEGNFNRFGKWRKPPGPWTPTPESLLESQEFRAVFQTCMSALPARLREAFALRVVEGLDAAETCRMLEISSANLWTLLYRARERLRRCLEGKWLTKGER